MARPSSRLVSGAVFRPDPAAHGLPILDALERVDQGIALTDNAGMVRWCNSTLADCYLHIDTAEGWRGRSADQLFRPLFPCEDEWCRIAAALARLRHAPKGRIEIDGLSLAWGGRRMRSIDLVLNDFGGEPASPYPGWAGWYFYDVTEFRKTEENLQALLRHSSDGIFMFDADCRLRLFNEACERITGYRAEDVMHSEFSCGSIFNCTNADCIHKLKENIPELMAGQFCFRKGAAPHTQELLIKRKDGESAWVEISYAPVSDDDGQVAYVLGILRDVTQRRQLEDQLRLTRKLATLGELSSAMAHEIKNPLGIILSAAEIIMNPQRPEDQKRQAAEFIRDEAKRLDERMKVFLKFSRPKPPEFTSQNIHRILTQTIIAYRTLSREGLEIKTDFAPNLPRVSIDTDQMQQVFLNLLMNADQAMPAGGTIAIATRLHEGTVQIEIADEGIGLPEGDQSRLFEPFFSTKAKGTGLGLSIVMQIVMTHHGKVEARNRPDGGALFTVTLPLA